MIPPVGEQDAADIQKQAGDCSRFLHRSFFRSIGSSLPQNSCVFQRDRNAVAVRYHSRRIVRCWAGRRHRRAVNVAARCAGQLADALHLLPNGIAAVDSVGIKLDPHRLGVEVIEIDLNLKTCCSPWFPPSLRRSAAGPFLFQGVLPIDHLPADCAFIGSALTVGGRSREVVLLGVFAHRAVGGEARCQPRHAFPHPR